MALLAWASLFCSRRPGLAIAAASAIAVIQGADIVRLMDQGFGLAHGKLETYA
jgi:hypothetical protein